MQPARTIEVLLAFGRLGCTAFGGPIAHLGYFREEFVRRRRWLDDETYADLVSLCQLLPGPASSQVGFSLGLMRAGYAGGLAAWAGFTLPSALLMLLFAAGAGLMQGPLAAALLHGLKLVAVAIVAQAVWSMARSLCPDWPRRLLAIGAMLLTLLLHSATLQLLLIVAGGMTGWWWFRRTPPPQSTHRLAVPVSRRAALIALAVFVLLLTGLPVLAHWWPRGGLALFAGFYQAGALVFGGGHVVLPLLEETIVRPGWVSHDAFLAGYGAAQAVPGPLFTFAGYLGAVATAPDLVTGSAWGLAGIFLPGLLLVLGTLPFWHALRHHAPARGVMTGINATVVGLLAAALCDPVWTSAVLEPRDAVIAAGATLVLLTTHVPTLLVIAATVGAALV